MTKTAYCKLLLHLSKYPYLACNGLLLAKNGGDKDSSIEIVDCIPLFHSSLTLAPSFEIALTQIDYYCQKNGLNIIGYYQSNENVDDNQLVFDFRIAFQNIKSYLSPFIFVSSITRALSWCLGFKNPYWCSFIFQILKIMFFEITFFCFQLQF